MKSKTLVALIALLLVCVAFVIVRNTSLFRRERSPDANTTEPVFSPPPQDVRKLVIVSAQGRRLAFDKRDGDWRLVEPVAAKAASAKVSSLADTIAKLESERSFAPGEADAVDDTVTYLDKPLWTVELVGADGRAVKLLVGKTTPLRKDRTYVRPEGDVRTYVVGKKLAELLKRPPREYRDKTVMSLTAEKVVRVSVSGREVRGTYELRKHKGEWGITAPVSAKANNDAVRDLIGAVGHVSAAEFVADEPASLAAYGLEPGKERLVVRLWVESNKPLPTPTTAATTPATAPAPPPEVHAIAFGAKAEDKVYAKLPDEPAVFQVRASLVDDVLKNLQKVRRKTVLDFEAGAVIGVDMELPDGPANLARQDNDEWLMSKPRAGKANSRMVDDLLAKMSTIEAQSWADQTALPPSVTGLAKPYAQIVLHLMGTSETLRLLVGSTTGTGETYVQAAGSTSIATVKSSELQPLLASGAGYWHPVLFKLPTEHKVTRLVMKRRDNTFEIARGDDNAWTLTAPVAAPCDGDRVRKIIARLSDMTAVKVAHVGPDVPEKYLKAIKSVDVELYARAPQPTTVPTSAPTTAPTTAASTQPTTAPSTRPAAPSTASAPALTQPTTGPTTRTAHGPEALAARIRVVKLQGKSFAWLPGEKPLAVGEFSAELYEDLAAELRDRAIWSVDPNEVRGVRIAAGPERTELRKEGSDWVNAQNPDEKLDSAKVGSFLNELQGLKADSFMTYKYAEADANKLGLTDPWVTVELKFSQGEPKRLVVSNRGQDETTNRYAAGADVDGIFVLPSGSASKLAKTLSDFRK
ncbi:MAG TPA: DUF4340 domain-containing protein [Phycisphaerae bacterium]|nr:DUF4340 domain-containing protein [Phycisphaerae bacterium]